MGRVLLIIGAVIGGLVLAIGVLGLIINATTPGPDQGSGYLGAFIIIFVGAVIAVPCTFFAYRITPKGLLGYGPAAQSGLPTPGADVQQRYRAWFTWCQQALAGGDAVSLHAATMAAMVPSAADNPTAAASAEAARHSNRVGSMGAMAAPPKAAKVKMLSRIGASTVGLLEPGERVLVSFYGVNRSMRNQMYGAAFGAIGQAIAAGQSGAVFVTVTDRRVIALGAGQFGGLANKVLLMEHRAGVAMKSKKFLLSRTVSFKGLSGSSVSMTVPGLWRAEVEMAVQMLNPAMGSAGTVGVIR
jgi:hypothetical protein